MERRALLRSSMEWVWGCQSGKRSGWNTGHSDVRWAVLVQYKHGCSPPSSRSVGRDEDLRRQGAGGTIA